jgi:hypothetical protein
MKYMILIHTALVGSSGGGRGTLWISFFLIFPLVVERAKLRIGVRLECEAKGAVVAVSAGIVLAARQVACRVGSRDGAAPLLAAPSLIATWPWLPRDPSPE